MYVTEHAKFTHNAANIGDNIWRAAARPAAKYRQFESLQRRVTNILRRICTSRASITLSAVFSFHWHVISCCH